MGKIALAALVAWGLAAPASAGILKSIGDAVKSLRPQAEAVDPRGYQKLTRLIVVGGETLYTPTQELILSRVEQGLSESGCWQVMGHAQAREKLRPASVGAPSPRTWKDDGQVASEILARLPKRDARLGVLVLWVRQWRGDVYSRDTVSEAVDLWIDKRINQPGSPKPTRGEYERDAVAELFASDTGAVLWRGHMLFPSGTPLDERGRLPYADQATRDAQVQKEYDDFIGYFVKNLRQPPNMENGCTQRAQAFTTIGRGAAPSTPARAAKEDIPPTADAGLKSGDPAARIAAIQRLAQPDDQSALPLLIPMLSDPDIKVRAHAIDALGRVGSPKAADAVIAKLSDPAPLLRALAARALIPIGSAKGKPALERLLAVEKEPVVRQEAQRAVQLLDDPADIKMDEDMDNGTGFFAPDPGDGR